jgi:Ca2+/Na+ antiporter
MTMPVVIMLISSVAIIGLVKYGLVPGIDKLSASLGWSLKARGKATGYATSVPELVTLVAAGLSGVWEAGLWNIASSNLINLSLAVIAIMVHKRLGEVGNRRFLKEIVFAFVGILAPLLLMTLKMDTHVAVIPCLFVLFGAYLLLDKGDGEPPECQGDLEESSVFVGLLTIAVTLGFIVVAGNFLGDATRSVVVEMGVPAAAAGWILGLVTSLPEAVTFFTVFSSKRVAGSEDHCEQMQELLDNLAASNMSNSALIYPLGLAIFLLGTGVG